MDVNMHSGLPASFPNVHPDVIAVRGMLLLDKALGLIQQGKHSGLFVRGHVEEVSGMALGNNQNVTTAERIVVVARVSERVLYQDLIRHTQLTITSAHHDRLTLKLTGAR